MSDIFERAVRDALTVAYKSGDFATVGSNTLGYVNEHAPRVAAELRAAYKEAEHVRINAEHNDELATAKEFTS